MKLRHLFFACSGVFVMMFSLLLLVVIVFSDEEDGGSGGNLIYGGVSVSQEVLAHMISKGHTYYQSRKLDRVPREAVEELLGITFTDKSN